MAGLGAKQMSLEAAMEEERKEVEALISMQQASRRAPSVARSTSPYPNPRSPVRSMLDIGGDEPRSPPPQATVRSMLDVDSPPPTARHTTRSMLDIDSAVAAPTSTHTSPTLSFKSPVLDNTTRHRSMSDAASQPATDLPLRSPPLLSPRATDPLSTYKFHDILTPNVGPSILSKRGSAAGVTRTGSLGEALRGSNNKSKSPNNRFALRSSSPFGASSAKRTPQQRSFMMGSDEIDPSTAYRRLSDAHLAYGNSSLASLARKNLDFSDGHGRIAKDNLSPYGELLPDESDDEAANSSEEENQRGRKLTTRAESQDERAVKSLMAAVEDERKHVSSVQPQYRSLFDDPAITITSPTGEKSKAKGKQSVQPATSFDEPLSGTQTPLDPDLDADVSAIKFAQRMQLSLTPIISAPEVHRSIRLIYRGEYSKIQREAEEEHRRLRKYLVATDLSDESTHALEWAIGTVLRDGDTLIAMYCLDEESSGSIDAGSLVPDDPKAMKEQAAAINAMTKATNAGPGQRSSMAAASPFTFGRATNSPRLRAVDGGGSVASSPAPGSKGKSKLEEERERAVVDITERVSKLLRKTQLQVRVIVEVIHCKNPKHLITEVIDIVNPTLVVLGSRGRSALKGTLLGSFSNYLVTKSSVPVMVARKRLRKKSKYQPPPTKQVNNLANPAARSLEMARID
ncbi:adenine nucleotide alpha hydrolases-like protein [Xylariaceae sp. FL1272]|nr:adenine nucleotide alpha hydrolases-like protein [Xylariaceae sp. FL1272]